MSTYFRTLAMGTTACLWALSGQAALAGQETCEGRSSRTCTSVEEWSEKWNPYTQRWERVGSAAQVQPSSEAARRGAIAAWAKSQPPAGAPTAVPPRDIAYEQFGPFIVLDARRAAIIAVTDSRSPAHFADMLRRYPGLEVLEFIEAPGTRHDVSNFALGRTIRALGLETHIPDGGSARSGAVELFLAGKNRRIADGAKFAVHSWRDIYGRQAHDYAPDGPENRLYLDYYREMGMGPDQARAFYAMTNSVPFSQARWLTGAEMRKWLKQ